MGSNTKRSAIGERLYGLRKNKVKQSQQDIADFLGIKRDTFARYETNTTPPLDIIVKLRDYYNTTLEYIIEGVSEYQTAVNQSIVSPKLGQAPRPPISVPGGLGETEELTDDEWSVIDCFRKLPQDVRIAYLTIINNSKFESDI